MSKIEEYIIWIDACAEYQLQEIGDERGYANFLTVAALLRAGQEMREDLSNFWDKQGLTPSGGAQAWDAALNEEEVE